MGGPRPDYGPSNLADVVQSSRAHGRLHREQARRRARPQGDRRPPVRPDSGGVSASRTPRTRTAFSSPTTGTSTPNGTWPDRWRHRRDQGALRLRVRRLPAHPSDRADRLRVPRRRVAAQRRSSWRRTTSCSTWTRSAAPQARSATICSAATPLRVSSPLLGPTLKHRRGGESYRVSTQLGSTVLSRKWGNGRRRTAATLAAGNHRGCRLPGRCRRGLSAGRAPSGQEVRPLRAVQAPSHAGGRPRGRDDAAFAGFPIARHSRAAKRPAGMRLR